MTPNPAPNTAPVAPRHFRAEACLPGAGLPSDRLARMAARRAFVSLKLAFLQALDAEAGADAAWLRSQVRQAEEPVDLWLLRAPAFEVLSGAERKHQRHALRRALDGLFPDSQPASGFSPF